MNKRDLYRTTLILFFHFLVLSSIFAQQVEFTSELQQQIDELFESYQDSRGPGATIAVVRDGKTLYTNGYGSANLEYQIPITPQTIFHTASLSKQFTAFAVLLLEAEGKLSMQDDIRQYVPEVPDFGHPISLLQLASHQSGLRDQWDLLQMAGWRMDDVITQEHILKLIERQQALNFPPGEEHLYCNTGFTLLAEVVARVSGMSFADFTQQQIFEPLGMNNTIFYDNHEQLISNRAYSYKPDGDQYKKSTLSYSTVGATSLFSTAEDMAKWAANFTLPVIGSQAIIDQLNSVPELNNGEAKGFALGQFRGTYQGIKVFVHSGSDAGYKAYFARVPDHNLAVVVLANYSAINPIEQVFGVVNLFLEDHFTEEASVEKKIFQPDPSSFVNLPEHELISFTGEYWEPIEGYSRKIILRDDTLVYYRSSDSETKLVPVGQNEFKMLGDSEDVSVIFTKNSEEQACMQIFINDRPPLELLAITAVHLADYQATFHSEELAISYTFKLKNGLLVAEHVRQPDIVLESICPNLFIAESRAIKKVEFIRDDEGKIIGIKVSNNRVRDLLFQRVD